MWIYAGKKLGWVNLAFVWSIKFEPGRIVFCYANYEVSTCNIKEGWDDPALFLAFEKQLFLMLQPPLSVCTLEPSDIP